MVRGMVSLLVELLPFAVGLAVTPAAIAATILFLAGHERPVDLGVLFVFGALFTLKGDQLVRYACSALRYIVPLTASPSCAEGRFPP